MASNFSEQDIRRIVVDEVFKLFSKFFNLNQAQDIEWMTTKEATVRLNYPSQDSLRKDISNGNLRVGYEVQDRRNKNSQKPIYYFNYKKCVERLNTLPEKRSA